MAQGRTIGSPENERSPSRLGGPIFSLGTWNLGFNYGDAMKRGLIIFFCMMFFGCSFGRDPDVVRRQYLEQIQDWQERVKREGWTRELIDDVARDTALLSSYRSEDTDHWSTPNEFLEAGLRGDCEDIAAGIYGSFKRLGYPHEIRILGVATVGGDHALVKVQLPSGEWMVYETVYPWNSFIDWIFYRPFVEFNTENIAWANSKQSSGVQDVTKVQPPAFSGRILPP